MALWRMALSGAGVDCVCRDHICECRTGDFPGSRDEGEVDSTKSLAAAAFNLEWT